MSALDIWMNDVFVGQWHQKTGRVSRACHERNLRWYQGKFGSP